MKFDILFLGKLFPREKEKEIKSKMKTGMQDAGNALQWNIIDGLDANDCGTIKILDYLPIDSYPNGYEDKNIEEYVFQHTDKYKSDDKIVKCTNLTVVKQFFNFRPFKKEVKKWAEKNDGRRKIVVVYTAVSMFLKLALYAKKINKDIETMCIIADIPEFLSARKLHGIRKLFNMYETNQSAVLYKHIDKYVLLTAQMAEKLKIKSPFIVVEGIAPSENENLDCSLADKYRNEKYIFYGGTLNYEFGIKGLLDAFAQIEKAETKLVICGFGEADEIIKERQKTDDRIIYLGKVERSQAIALQRGATVLVNPRQNNEEFTKYSFPSKTLEYLASGVPVIAYKLDGIPDEYDNYICYVEDNTPATLAKTIVNMCEKTDDERCAIGEKARNFVLAQKNPTKQALRILNFMKEEM